MANMTNAQRKARTARITSRVAFGIGVTVSLAANVTASAHTPLGIAVGLWTPVAFLVSMALIENVPARGVVGKLRLVAIVFLALIAGWNSYWHMVEVLDMAGVTDPITRYLLPLTVDVMMALASPGMRAKAVAPVRRKPAARKNVVSISRAKKSA
jgi:hypothetical protein